ncbi:bacteriocin family protein [Candidatus Sumerlaeota bacterium]|nr:bacteriocin family protein [Candidatus Sumerlaeota bacterium]
MASDILRRDKAPIAAEAWQLIDEEAKRVLRGQLSARSIVDLDGPYDWRKDSVNLGTLELIQARPQGGICWGLRRLQPLVEVRAPFKLSQAELDSVSRGNDAPDLTAVSEAARKIALFEESAVFKGLKEAGIEGIAGAAKHKRIVLPKTAEGLDSAVAEGVETLQLAGVGGPYALVLGTKPYQAVLRGRWSGGYPLQRAIGDKIRGAIHWSPAIEGGALLSTRGGDFQLTVGQDFSIGYLDHDTDTVGLYLVESFTFRVLEPKAAVTFTLGK